MQQNISDGVAVVVGAGGGFGSAIAERLAAAGVSIALAGRNQTSLEAVAKRIVRQGGRAIIACGDVSEKHAVAEIYRKTYEQLGSPTILIDAAALPGPFGPIGNLDIEEWWSSIEVHLKAPALLIRQFLPDMLQGRRGSIIIVSSMIGKAPYPYLSAYSIGKGSQAALVAHAAAEYPDSGVSFFAIQPGFARTGMTEQTLTSPEFRKWAPGAVTRIEALIEVTDHVSAFRACGERCLQLASGKYESLSGRFIMPDDDLERLIAADNMV